MIGFSQSKIINCSTDRVFAFLTDMRRTPEYITTLQALIQLTDGPLGVGTHFSEIRRLGYLKYKAELWISQYVENERLSLTSRFQGISTTYHYVLTPQGESTQIELICEILATGIQQAFTPLIGLFAWVFDGRHISKMKEVIESTHLR